MEKLCANLFPIGIVPYVQFLNILPCLLIYFRYLIFLYNFGIICVAVLVTQVLVSSDPKFPTMVNLANLLGFRGLGRGGAADRSCRRRRRVAARCSAASVLDVCTGSGDIGGVRDERQERCQPQVHRCPGCCFSSLLPLLGVIGILQSSLQ
jgi:hypothetical protein